MAKRKVISDEIVDNLNIVEDAIAEQRDGALSAMVQAIDDQMTSDAPELTDVLEGDYTAPASEPPAVVQAEPPPLVVADDVMQRVSFVLPRAVLYALIDPTFEGADEVRAARYGLLGAAVGELSPIGQLVLDGTDVIALRHVINRAARFAQNAALGPSKVERIE